MGSIEKSKHPIVVTSTLSGLVSFLATSITIVSFGWNLHKSILEDVDAQQMKAITNIEQKFNDALKNKLEKQPAAYQINTQGSQLSDLTKQVVSSDKKLVQLQATVDEIKNFLIKKEIAIRTTP